MGRIGSNPKNPTITIYGHYDVVPAHYTDGWETHPFNLTGKDGYLYGRGVTDDKGPIVATVFAGTSETPDTTHYTPHTLHMHNNIPQHTTPYYTTTHITLYDYLFLFL